MLVLGIIGIGGVGKFSFVDELICCFLCDFLEKLLGIILVDFFKCWMGGVLLGDWIWMNVVSLVIVGDWVYMCLLVIC